MAGNGDNDPNRLDNAARAGWLYYVAGDTQDTIARKLGISRQAAQRLVSLAMSERLIKIRIDHPIARCMDLSQHLIDRFGLSDCIVVPSDPDATSSLAGVALAGAAELERYLKSDQPKIIAMGTGRTMRACVGQVMPMKRPQHRIVSMLGNMNSDGSATPYNVVARLAEHVNAKHFPMPLALLAKSPEEKGLMHTQEPVRNTLDLVRQADVTFVGIGGIGEDAPLAVDGFLLGDELRSVIDGGGIGEITAWIYDCNGRLIEGPFNDRVAGAPLEVDPANPVIAIAVGENKVPAILGAIRGKLINGLITNEATAESLLDPNNQSGVAG